jgi:hypothetical protein
MLNITRSAFRAKKHYDIKKRFPTVWSVGNVYYMHNELFSESEFFNQLAVTLEIGLAQISEQALSFTNQLHQTPMSGEVFLIGLQMLRNPVDPLCQQRNLALNGTGIGGLSTEISKETRFFLFCQIRHLNLFFVHRGWVITEFTHPRCTANDGPSASRSVICFCLC